MNVLAVQCTLFASVTFYLIINNQLVPNNNLNVNKLKKDLRENISSLI